MSLPVDPKLEQAIIEYPQLIQNIITFITQPACVRLISAGGQYKGVITIHIEAGQVAAMVPGMELRKGKEFQ